VNKSSPIAIIPLLASGRRRAANAPEGSATSGKALGEVACLSPDAALQRLSSTAGGLTPDQVEARLRSAGLNQVAHQARHTILGELIGRSINPLNLLLLSLATASYFLGDQRAAIVIAVMVVLSISLSFIQEHRSNNAADKLRRMVSITATVRRQVSAEAHDHVDVPVEQLVPGDIVLLSAGDMVPADLRLITAKDLFLNQSTLTGEAMPLEKVATAHVGTAETPFDLPNICFMGSAVVSGIGCGVVVLTGPRTAFGLVASEIAKQRVPTSFDKGITRFTWLTASARSTKSLAPHGRTIHSGHERRIRFVCNSSAWPPKATVARTRRCCEMLELAFVFRCGFEPATTTQATRIASARMVQRGACAARRRGGEARQGLRGRPL
jgi:Mg2+-importing ATPase